MPLLNKTYYYFSKKKNRRVACPFHTKGRTQNASCSSQNDESIKLASVVTISLLLSKILHSQYQYAEHPSSESDFFRLREELWEAEGLTFIFVIDASHYDLFLWWFGEIEPNRSWWRLWLSVQRTFFATDFSYKANLFFPLPLSWSWSSLLLLLL